MRAHHYYWTAWERGERDLFVGCRQELCDLLHRYNQRATGPEKAAMISAYPIYTQAASIPYWCQGEDDRRFYDPRFSLFLDRLGPAGRQSLGDLRTALFLFFNAR